MLHTNRYAKHLPSGVREASENRAARPFVGSGHEPTAFNDHSGPGSTHSAGYVPPSPGTAAASSAASLSTDAGYEARLVNDITTPAGVKVAPQKEQMREFVNKVCFQSLFRCCRRVSCTISSSCASCLSFTDQRPYVRLYRSFDRRAYAGGIQMLSGLVARLLQSR